jgi:hypothetical protein
MPTNRTRRKRLRNQSELTDDQVFYLLNGFCLDGHTPDFNHPRVGGILPRDCPFETPETMRQAWEDNREAIMPKAVPFLRPWGWWQHDAPEPRRRTAAVYGFGPDGWRHYLPGTTGLYNPKTTEAIEADRDFLIRLGLLNANERELLEVEKQNGQKEIGGAEAGAAVP